MLKHTAYTLNTFTKNSYTKQLVSTTVSAEDSQSVILWLSVVQIQKQIMDLDMRRSAPKVYCRSIEAWSSVCRYLGQLYNRMFQGACDYINHYTGSIGKARVSFFLALVSWKVTVSNVYAMFSAYSAGRYASRP